MDLTGAFFAPTFFCSTSSHLTSLLRTYILRSALRTRVVLVFKETSCEALTGTDSHLGLSLEPPTFFYLFRLASLTVTPYLLLGFAGNIV